MKYFKNTSWLFAEKVIRLLVGFFVLILLTRYLGPERFGILSYSQSLISIFVAVATLGLDAVVIREIVKKNYEENVLIGTAFYLKVIASAIVLAIVFIMNSFVDSDDGSVYIANIIAFSLIFQSINVIDTYFQSKVISKYVVYSNIIAFLISSFIKLVLIYYEVDLVYFAYALVFDTVIIAFGYLYIYKYQKKSVLDWSYNNELAKYYLKNALPLILVTLTVFIYARIDQVMIKHMIDNEAVGNYAAAVRVSELFYFIPGLIAQSVFPKIIEVKNQNDEKEYYKLLEMLYSLSVWIVIPIALSMAYFTDNIVSILYGSQYSQASVILFVLSFAIIFNAIGAVSTKILYAEHFEKKYLYRSLFGMLINVVLNMILIQLYGVLGAAIATIITLFAIHYVYDLFDKQLMKFYYMKWKCFVSVKINFKGTK